MAIKDYSTFITEALTSDGFPERADGWLLKHTDTGLQYIRRSGQWEELSLGLSFAPPTKSGDAVTDDDGEGSVTFGTPFIDDDYSIQFSCSLPANERSVVVLFTSQNANGFTFVTQEATRRSRRVGNIEVTWLATRSFNE